MRRVCLQLIFGLAILPLLSPDTMAQRRGGFGDSGDGPVERLAPHEIEFEDGTASVPDRETFDKLSYIGPDVMIDTHLAHQQFVKFQIEYVGTDREPELYFINTKTHRGHPMFMHAVGITRGGGERGNGPTMRGVLIFHPNRKALDENGKDPWDCLLTNLNRLTTLSFPRSKSATRC